MSMLSRPLFRNFGQGPLPKIVLEYKSRLSTVRCNFKHKLAQMTMRETAFCCRQLVDHLWPRLQSEQSRQMFSALRCIGLIKQCISFDQTLFLFLWLKAKSHIDIDNEFLCKWTQSHRSTHQLTIDIHLKGWKHFNKSYFISHLQSS